MLIRFGFTTKEIMVCPVVNGKKTAGREKLIQSLTELEGMTSITLSVNRERPMLSWGKRFAVRGDRNFITDYIGTVKYQISPLSFYQVNPAQTEKLYSLALEYAGLTGEDRLGSVLRYRNDFTFSGAEGEKKFTAWRIVPEAIADAKNNAKINGIEKCRVFVGKSEEALPEYYEK